LILHIGIPAKAGISVSDHKISQFPQSRPIIQNIKSVTSRKINKIKKSPGSHLWQRKYLEHIIRDEQDLNRIRKYIIENPLKWCQDKYYI
jgi:REP element-mobilizing transposase RayT